MAMPLTSHIIVQMELTSFFETKTETETKPTQSSQITDQNLRKVAHALCAVSVHAKRVSNSCRKVRNAFECFVTQVQTRLPKTKCVWPMKINVICTVYIVRLRKIAELVYMVSENMCPTYLNNLFTNNL